VRPELTKRPLGTHKRTNPEQNERITEVSQAVAVLRPPRALRGGAPCTIIGAPALGASGGDSVFGPLGDEATLETGDRAEHVKAAWSWTVDCLS